MSWAPTGLGKDIFEQRYALEGESWQEACKRVAAHVAHGEGTYVPGRFPTQERFQEELEEGRFMPGGRIWANAGKPKPQLLNCFVLPVGDSREGWGKAISDTIVVSGLGGGVGINCSPVRGRGTLIKGTGGTATGAVSFMEMVNAVGDVLRTGGGRRLALMLALEQDHPDLPEFLDKKLSLDQLNNANVSVILTESTNDFVREAKRGRHTELWERIVQNAWQSGEPGVLNSWLANKQSNIFYHKPLICTNPCGEIWLESYGCCDLGALVLPRFVKNSYMDWDTLKKSIYCAVRFLDNVLTVNHYPLEEIKKNSQGVRRLGLGVMGLHTALLELGYKYSSEAGLRKVNEIFAFIKRAAYEASISLAKEKGAFTEYSNQLLHSGFAKTLPNDLREDISTYGLRNCALLTVAPTGTTGMVHGVSTGIEPLFAPVYYRRYYQGEHLHKELVLTEEFKRFGALAEGAYDVPVEAHFAMQATVQSHIDNAVSKTINLPEDYDPGKLSDIWLEYLPQLKGSTFYREGSRGAEPLEPIRGEAIELIQHLNQQGVADIGDQYGMDCVGGSCEI